MDRQTITGRTQEAGKNEGEGPMKRTSKPYAIKRVGLDGGKVRDYARFFAHPEIKTMSADESDAWRDSCTSIRRKSKVTYTYGRFFYCLHCGKRMRATDAVVLWKDTAKNVFSCYWSCGNHGEEIIDHSLLSASEMKETLSRPHYYR